MARFISHRNPVSTKALKRRPNGSVVVRHYGRVDVRFTRCAGGWLRDVDVTVVSSSYVANECNRSVGCASSWAKVY